MALILKWDRERRLRPVPGEELDSWQLIEPNRSGLGSENDTIPDHLEGRRAVWSAGAAFSPLFRLLPGGGPFAQLADRFPGAAERGYRWVADHRSAFGKPIPDSGRRWADRVIAERGTSESEPDGR